MPETDVAPTVADCETPAAIDPESVSNPETLSSARNHAPELRERVKRLYFQGIRPETICAETGLKRTTLRTWINRYGWLRTVHAARAIVENREVRALAIQPNPPSAGSNLARETLAKVLQTAASKLATVDPKASVKEIRKLGKALEPLVRSGKILHNWGNDAPGGVVIAEVLGHERQSPAITVQAEQLSCGPDTTTGSVPPTAPEQATPQLTQPVDNQPSPQAPN